MRERPEFIEGIRLDAIEQLFAAHMAAMVRLFPADILDRAIQRLNQKEIGVGGETGILFADVGDGLLKGRIHTNWGEGRDKRVRP